MGADIGRGCWKASDEGSLRLVARAKIGNGATPAVRRRRASASLSMKLEASSGGADRGAKHSALKMVGRRGYFAAEAIRSRLGEDPTNQVRPRMPDHLADLPARLGRLSPTEEVSRRSPRLDW